jgi:hypothetical protein
MNATTQKPYATDSTPAQLTAEKFAIANSMPPDEAMILQGVDRRILIAAAQGKIDLNAMAREELANRGLDQRGEYVGFRKSFQVLPK